MFKNIITIVVCICIYAFIAEKYGGIVSLFTIPIICPVLLISIIELLEGDNE